MADLVKTVLAVPVADAIKDLKHEAKRRSSAGTFKSGDIVKIKDRTGLAVGFAVGDIAVVLHDDDSASTSILALGINGYMPIHWPTERLELHEEE